MSHYDYIAYCLVLQDQTKHNMQRCKGMFIQANNNQILSVIDQSDALFPDKKNQQVCVNWQSHR